MGVKTLETSMSRRAFVLNAAVLSSALIASPALAEESASPFSQMSVGDYVRTFDPEAYASLSSEMRTVLDSTPMFDEAGSMARADIGGTLALDAYKTGSSIRYDFTFSVNQYCSSLYTLVTVTSNSTGTTHHSRGHYGSGSYFSGGATTGSLPSGGYTVYGVGYSPTPPSGLDSRPIQRWLTRFV